MKRIYLIGLLVLIVAVMLVWWLQSDDGSQPGSTADSSVPEESPLDTVLNFYTQWHDAQLSTSTNPFDAGLSNSELLSTEVQQYISDRRDDAIDPVLCQPTIPPRIGGKPVFQEGTSAQVQVLARGLEAKSPHLAIVSLSAVDGAWQISDISCQSGESGPEREFSFERQGQLLKSVPEPLNSDYWHLIFTENNTPGHAVPLFFDENSMCIDEQGEASVCNEEQFTQTVEVTVKGEMSESGVTVKEMVF